MKHTENSPLMTSKADATVIMQGRHHLMLLVVVLASAAAWTPGFVGHVRTQGSVKNARLMQAIARMTVPRIDPITPLLPTHGDCEFLGRTCTIVR